MAVNKVEYKLDSSTEGFAAAGDTVTVKSSNATTIKKDVDEGNTQELSSGQRFFLNNKIQSNDNVDYEGEDNPNGEELPDINGNKKSGDKTGSTISAVSAVATTGATMFAAGVLANSQPLLAAMCAPIAPVVGGLESTLSTVALAGATVFDPLLVQRMSLNSNANSYMSEIDESIDSINEDIETLSALLEGSQTTEGNGTTEETGETGETGKTGESEPTQPDNTEVLTQIEELNAQLAECEAKGDTEEADAIRAQIEVLQASINGTEGSNENEEDDPIQLAIQNNELANSRFEQSSNAAEKLSEGTELGSIGATNTTLLGACTAVSATMIGKAQIGAVPFFVAQAAVGSALCIESTVKFGTATGIMAAKTGLEFACGAKGKDVNNKLSEMNDPLEAHNDLISQFESKSKESENNSGDTSAPTTTAPTTTAPTTTPTSGTSGGSNGNSGGSSGGSSGNSNT